MTEALPRASLVLLLDDGKVLLAGKKRGFGKGKIVGIGGRQEASETILETAIREMQEEVGVTPLEPKEVARLEFLFPQKPSWSMVVHVFTATAWRGEPSESDEVAPQWFALDALPFDEMWDDARTWLPEVLAGKVLGASFIYGETLKVCQKTTTFR